MSNPPANSPETSGNPARQQATARTAGRKHVTQQVKTARAKLTSQTGIAPEFDNELLRTYARNLLSGGIILPVLAIVIAVAATTWSTMGNAGLWLIGVLFGNALMMYSARQFLREENASARKWTTRFDALEFFNGSLVGTLAFVPYDDASNAMLTFLFAATLMFLAIRTVLANNRPRAMLISSLPITLTAALRFLLIGGVLNYAMALFAIGAQVFFAILTYKMHQSYRSTLSLTAEKDALIGELEQSKSISDEARRRAEQANLAKSRFLATMSHELRTPLNAILGFSEVMKDELLGRHEIPAYREYSADIHRSGQHLLNLINEILDLSRIEAGRYNLSEEAVSLPNTVAECHHLLKLRAQERGVTIVEDIAPGLPKIWADERAVRQIAINLLTNAIKFTPNGGVVTLIVGWTKGGGQYLSVKDNGPGIPDEEIPIIKQTFGRGSQALKSAEEGSGLGLPIVISLIELHGGRFDLQSKLREGTTVTVMFPRERVMTALPPLGRDTYAA
ncbi:MAG: sensor histidine kinase [Flavobacteriaceae bacterium]